MLSLIVNIISVIMWSKSESGVIQLTYFWQILQCHTPAGLSRYLMVVTSINSITYAEKTFQLQHYLSPSPSLLVKHRKSGCVFLLCIIWLVSCWNATCDWPRALVRISCITGFAQNCEWREWLFALCNAQVPLQTGLAISTLRRKPSWENRLHWVFTSSSSI